MAKTATPTKISDRAKEASGNMPKVVDNSSEMPDDLAGHEHTGRGVSSKAEDNLVPLIYILHYTSPQVDETDSRYIKGAQPGDIWLRGAPMEAEIVKRDGGVLVQSCYFYKDVGEWLPRSEGGGGGQGFKGRHAVEKPEEVPGAKKAPDGKPFHWTTADGEHDLVETRNHAVLIYWGYKIDETLKPPRPVPARKDARIFPYLIPFTSTRHQASRDWMSKMNRYIQQTGPGKGQPVDSFARVYTMTTEPRKNEAGKWFTFSFDDGFWATPDQLNAGLKLSVQFERGEKKAAEPEDDAGVDPAAGGEASGEYEEERREI